MICLKHPGVIYELMASVGKGAGERIDNNWEWEVLAHVIFNLLFYGLVFLILI